MRCNQPLCALVTLLTLGLVHPGFVKAAVSPAEARAIAKEVYIYGFPIVDGYRIQYTFFQDRGNPGFKAPWNTIHNEPNVFTSASRVVQTPTADTPYSALGADLRAEPLVLMVVANTTQWQSCFVRFDLHEPFVSLRRFVSSSTANPRQ